MAGRNKVAASIKVLSDAKKIAKGVHGLSDIATNTADSFVTLNQRAEDIGGYCRHFRTN